MQRLQIQLLRGLGRHSVIGAISPQLGRAEMERSQRKPTENMQAYDYYLRALFDTYQYTREGNVEALRLTKIAISRVPHLPLHTLLQPTFLERRRGWVDGGCCPREG